MMATELDVEKSERNHAQTLAIITFICVVAGVYGLESWISSVTRGSLRDILQLALYVAAFFAVFTIGPMTDFYQRQIAKRRR